MRQLSLGSVAQEPGEWYERYVTGMRTLHPPFKPTSKVAPNGLPYLGIRAINTHTKMLLLISKARVGR